MGHHHTELARNHGHEVVAGVDVSPDAREHFENKWGGVKTYESHEAMYDDAHPDAVVVTTPNKFHAPAAIDAFDRDISVLTEKPLADTLENAEAIARAHEASDGVGMVGFHNRFASLSSVAHDYVTGGDFGEVTHVETAYVRRRGIPGRGTWFVSKELSGGGALVDIGVHILDLTLHLMGFPEIEHVSGSTRREFGGEDDYAYLHMWGDDAEGELDFDVEDSATALIRTADGRTINLEVAWASNSPGRKSIKLRGTDGGATLDLQDGELTLHGTSDRGRAHHIDTDIETTRIDEKEAETEMFYDAVAAGEEPELNTVEQALTVQRVLDAIYRSSERGGETVRVDAIHRSGERGGETIQIND
jgi:predicted dehydrogenase